MNVNVEQRKIFDFVKQYITSSLFVVPQYKRKEKNKAKQKCGYFENS